MSNCFGGGGGGGRSERAPPPAPARAAEPAPRLWRPADGRAVARAGGCGLSRRRRWRPAEPAAWRPDPRQAARPRGEVLPPGIWRGGRTSPGAGFASAPSPQFGRADAGAFAVAAGLPDRGVRGSAAGARSGYSKDSRRAPRHFRGCWCSARAGSSRGCPETGRWPSPCGPLWQPAPVQSLANSCGRRLGAEILAPRGALRRRGLILREAIR